MHGDLPTCARRIPDEVRDALKEQGWVVERTNNNHLKFVPPDATQPICITGSTPSDWRAWKNNAAKLRRCGLKLPGRG